MHIIQAQTINGLIYGGLATLANGGAHTNSRNGGTLSLNNVFFTLCNPRSRHLNLKGRKNNIFAMIAETFWVLAGEEKIDPLLTFFLPRARDFSDDGVTWRGSYGPRLYVYGQLEDAIKMFEQEGLDTRRSVIALYLPEYDTEQSLRGWYGLEKTKDRPCNNMIHFYVTRDKKFHMNVFQRSGDIVWGMGSINVFEWTVLQELLLSEVRRRVDKEVTLGAYNHFVTNVHLYDFASEQGHEVLKNKSFHDFSSENNKPLTFPKGIAETRTFFKKLLRVYECAIVGKERNIDLLLKQVQLVFRLHHTGEVAQNDLMSGYTLVLAAYICAKNGNVDLTIDLRSYPNEFTSSIYNSHFRKFNLS